MPHGRVTLADIAKRAGVSKPTVSKILSDLGTYPEDTRERVKSIARELQYTPSSTARALRTGRTRTVGLITSDPLGRFSIPVLQGAEDLLRGWGVSIFLCDARGDLDRERQYVQMLQERDVEGIIVVGHRSDPRPPLPEESPIPVVFAYSASQRSEDRSVVPDDHQGGELAGQHLAEVGCRRIGYVGGPDDYAASHLRLSGLRAGAAGVEVTDTLFAEWGERPGRAAGMQLLDRAGEVPDGVFCANDQLARGVLDSASRLGIRVPKDLKIVGFDDWHDMTLATEPQLSSVYMDLKEVGRRAALHLITGTSLTVVEQVPCSIVIRGSSVLAASR